MLVAVYCKVANDCDRYLDVIELENISTFVGFVYHRHQRQFFS